MASYQHDTIKVGDKIYEATEALCGDGGEVETESIVVTPKTTAQTILPSEDKLIDKVDVTAVDRTIDINIQPENIKKGVDILGVEGEVTPATSVDRLQWKCDNMKSLVYEFYNYQGTDYSILEGLDTSKVENFQNMFYENSNMTTTPNLDLSGVQNIPGFSGGGLYNLFGGCYKLKNAIITLKVPTNMRYALYNSTYNSNYPVNITINNTEYIIDLTQCFNNRRFESINGGNTLDIPNCTNLNSAFASCVFYEMPELKLTNTQKVEKWSGAFSNGYCNLITLGNLDMISATENLNMFYRCDVLENLTIKNIKLNIAFQHSSKLTNASLLNIAQELWDNTDQALGGARTLTMSTPSKTAIQSIYVKLITPTAEQETEDPYINNKKPCIECESTEEGAMTLEEYIISKNWSIA